MLLSRLMCFGIFHINELPTDKADWLKALFQNEIVQRNLL